MNINSSSNTLKNGNLAYQNNRYELALTLYNEAIKKYPEINFLIKYNIFRAEEKLKKIYDDIIKTDKNSMKNMLLIQKQLIQDSILFDQNFYLEEYPDILSYADPAEHYLIFGGFEGRASSENFDAKAYLETYPELLDLKINPLVYYITNGRFSSEETYCFKRKNTKNISQHSTEISILCESHFFDRDFYVEKYQDVAESGLTPEDHFLRIGGPEGRNASKYFNCGAYLEAYEDVKNSGINPLIHYLIFGKKEKRVAFESDLEISAFLSATKSNKTIILDNLPDPAQTNIKKYRIALLIHAFYFDVFQDIFHKIKCLSFSEILVTTTSKHEYAIKSFLEKNWTNNFRVTVIRENRGRDIAPFLNENTEYLFDFDLVCKVHTKKSPHLDIFGNKWKNHLIENLVGSDEVFDKIVSLFIQNQKLGIAYPEPMLGTNNYDWAMNKDLALSVFKKLNIFLKEEELNELDYPPATMFWFKPVALKPLFKSYDYTDFPEEPIHFDGTLAHALERTLNYVCRYQGFETAEYISLRTISEENFKEAVVFDWLQSNRNREKFIIVSHEATNTGAPKTALSLLSSLKNKGKACLTILLNGGEQEELFDKYGPVINYNGQPLRESVLKILLENKPINVICNTVVSYKSAEFFQSIGLPVISLVHEFFSGGHFSEEMFTTLINNSDNVIYPANFVLEDTLNNLPVSNEKIEIMPQGIYNDNFPVGNVIDSRNGLINELGIPENSFIVLGCGTVESRKGVDLLVSAAKHIFSTIKADNLHFIWVGKVTKQDPFYLDCIQEISSICSLNGHFHFLGAHAQVDQYFLAADLFVLSSRHDPFPGVVLEAMAASLPVICFDKTTGVHEAFVHEIGGFVCKHLDIVDMAERIIQFYRHPELAVNMGHKNQQKVYKNYNFCQYTDRLLEKFSFLKTSNSGCTKFSIIVPVFNTPPNYLQKMILSVLSQTYKNFELCIADGSTNEVAWCILNYYSSIDKRIKCCRVENHGIAENTNQAIAMATGEYLCFLDHDDTLSKFSLQEIHQCVNNGVPDVIYTNEDKIDENGLNYFAPVEKPAFDIELLESYNYITHLLTVKKSFFDAHIIRLNSEYDGAQDYDLVLRCAEKTDRIQHIPKILYHWRVFENSTAKSNSSSKNYAVEAGRLALQAHFERTGSSASVVLDNKEFRYKKSNIKN